jgi:UDP-2,4-diacetamido-2,4,6-trideoxy-beta-L-altropyranose hydrolase
MDLADRLLKLRKVGQEDCELLWAWANDPIVRAVSFSSEPIIWEDHLKWFNEKLNSSSCYHFIFFNDQDEPIGQIRFDIDEQLQSIVSVSIASNQRNRGYGKLILQTAINELLKHISVNNIQALIKPDNLASIKLFESVGFKQLNLSPITPINTNILVLIYLP